MTDGPEKRKGRPIAVGQEVELTVESLAFGGEGVARHEGFTVFVPGALPGERVSAVVRLVKDRWARADVKVLREASPDRVTPPCPIFKECGGCQWQHLDYHRQLLSKRQAVSDALERIGRLKDVPVQPCLPSPNPYAYRNKALPVVSMRGGKFVAGIFSPRSHHLVPYESCPIQSDGINRLIRRALEKVEAAGLTPYQDRSHTGFLRHLVVRHGVGTGELLLAFVTNGKDPADFLTRADGRVEAPDQVLSRIAQELLAEPLGLVGVLQNVNPARTNVVLGADTRLLAGKDRFLESFDHLTLQVSLPSFLQVNTPQAELLHQLVREALGRPEGEDQVPGKWDTVLDLYGGIGTLALAVSDSAHYVLGVEEVAAAVADARDNAKRNHKGHLDFLLGDAADALLRLKGMGLRRVDAVLLDPPRKGVPPELLSRLAALHPERMVYVSCDPATLARDLALLCNLGYKVEWAQPLDMFPQTYHVETVVRLTRIEPVPSDLGFDPGGAHRSFRLPRSEGGTALPGGEGDASPASLLVRLGFRRPAPVPVYPSASYPEELPSFSAATPASEEGEGELLLEIPEEEFEGEGFTPPPDVLGAPRVLAPEGPPSKGKPLLRALRYAAVLALILTAGAAVRATFRPGKGSGVFGPQTQADLVPELPTGPVKHYELLNLGLRLGDHFPGSPERLKATAYVYRNGEAVETVGRQMFARLKAVPGERRLSGHWPVPYNALPGTYLVRMTVSTAPGKKPRIFESAFTIAPLVPQLMENGFTALTYEGGKHQSDDRIPPLDGVGPDRYENVAEWTRFLGADAFYFLGAETQVWGQVHKREFPFSRRALEVSRKYGKAIHRAGLKYGVYLTTFRVVGDDWAKAPYRFGWGYDRSNDRLEGYGFISLKDQSRQDQLVELLRHLQESEEVDLIGFDYIRTGEGGYEWAGDFAKDMDMEVPEGYGEWSEEEKALDLARRIERDKDIPLKRRFEWWRAHKVALTLKDMLDRARVTKPVFTFTLGWEMGHQHGQDPAMLIDAGVGVNNIMLYQRNAEQMQEMATHWPPYLDKGNAMYILGEMVDFNWVQKSLDPPGPQELYERETGTFATWYPHNASLGMYWHDLYRMIRGVKGPYTTQEWAVAGGKAFSFLRQAENVTPILTRLEAPPEVPAGMPFAFSVEVLNRSEQELTSLTLVQLDTTKDTYSELARVGPFNLPAGHRLRVSNLRLTLPREPHPERDNRWMAAVVVSKKGSREVRAFDFTYVKALTPEEARTRLTDLRSFQSPKGEIPSAPVLSIPRKGPPQGETSDRKHPQVPGAK